jgi:membrane-associated phospholipid phosphatase
MSRKGEAAQIKDSEAAQAPDSEAAQIQDRVSQTSPDSGRSAGRPLLPDGARRPAVVIVVVCVGVTAVLGMLLGHGAHSDWVDAAIDARVRAALIGDPTLLKVLDRLGTTAPVAVMTAILALACALRRRYRGAMLLVISVPAAAAITEWVLKPLVGRTLMGFLSFPSGHATGTFALATAVTVLLAGAQGARTLRLILSAAAFLLAAAVAVAMIAAGFHYFTDAIAGAAVGAGTVLLTALILDWLVVVWRRQRWA